MTAVTVNIKLKNVLTGRLGCAVVFESLSGPLNDGGVTVVSSRVTVNTDATGEASVLLETGNYKVYVLAPGGTISYEITVPSSGGPYELADLGNAGINPVFEIPQPGIYPPAPTVCTIGLAAGLAIALG